MEIRAAMHDAHHFKLAVQDAGIGIKKEDLRRLFKEFEQLESAASSHHEGTGLGLALTRKIVELQGGTIGVESEIGQGSLFTVVLPLVHNQGQPTVLVVDDDPDIQELFKSFLKKNGLWASRRRRNGQGRHRKLAKAKVRSDVFGPAATGRARRSGVQNCQAHLSRFKSDRDYRLPRSSARYDMTL